MSQQCHFQTSVCYMHYIKRDIFVFKVNLHSFKKEKSKKMQKRHKTWLIFSLLMYKRNTRTFSISTSIPFCFFTLPITPLCTTLCLAKCSKCVFNRAYYLILFQINIRAMKKLTIDMFQKTNYKKKCIHGLISATIVKKHDYL